MLHATGRRDKDAGHATRIAPGGSGSPVGCGHSLAHPGSQGKEGRVEGADALGLIAEIGIAIAGFAGVIATLRAPRGRMGSYAVMRIGNLLAYSALGSCWRSCLSPCTSSG